MNLFTVLLLWVLLFNWQERERRDCHCRPGSLITLGRVAWLALILIFHARLIIPWVLPSNRSTHWYLLYTSPYFTQGWMLDSIRFWSSRMHPPPPLLISLWENQFQQATMYHYRFLNYHNHKLSTLNAIAWCNSRGQCHFIPRYDYGIWITANRISKCESRNNNHLQNPQKNEWQSESLMEKQIERRRESHTQYHIRMPARSAAASETRDFLLFGCCCCCSVVFRKT